MRKLTNIKDYDTFVEHLLDEGLVFDESQSKCNKAFLNLGTLTFADGSSVTTREIVQVVEEALAYLRSQYRKTFIFGDETLNIVYLAHSKKYKTMAVDSHMNMYLNAGFVFHNLKMDKILIAAVILHEVFHALFNHIERGKNWLVAKGKPQNEQTWHDLNLAADVEVNRTLTKIDIINEDRLINEIHGMYLKSDTRDIVPMEQILDDEKLMNKLRSMCPPPVDPEQSTRETIQTTEEWDQGYKDAWTKIADLIKKYGYKKVWQKLQDEGIINSVGEITSKKVIDDMKGLEFLQIKSYNEFINEGVEEKPGQTYEDGYNTAFGKLINSIRQAIEGKDGEEGYPGPQGPQIKSNLKNDDLPQIELPLPPGDDDGDDGQGGDGTPENIKNTNPEENKNNSNDNENDGDGQDGQDGQESNDHQKGQKQSGKGGQGKSSDQLTDDDVNKLADDIESRESHKGISDAEFGDKKQKSGSQESGEEKEGQKETDKKSIGGTGSFQEEGLSDDELRESGYSDGDIEEINKTREKNKSKNSKERIEEVIEKQKKALSSGHILKRYLDAIEVESAKYKNIWKKILDKFLAKNTRRAGKDKATGSNDWLNKKHIARGEYGIHRKKQSQDPQDINVYVDVSGSVDMELLEIICQSLAVYMDTYQYSGINICPWASVNNGVFSVDPSKHKDKKAVVKEILAIVSTGEKQCGGGTESKAAISAILDGVEKSLDDKRKKIKDDVHIVITDGYFDYQGIEAKMKASIKNAFGRGDVSDIVPKNTFWMLYDTDERNRDRWEKEIQKGTLIFINTEVVKNNK